MRSPNGVGPEVCPAICVETGREPSDVTRRVLKLAQLLSVEVNLQSGHPGRLADSREFKKRVPSARSVT
jgi:hypothetical protein